MPLGYASVDKKLIILPDEAETVRMIFQKYLELGSVRLLAAELDRQGIVTKRRILSTGRSIGGGRFGVGGLNHLLRSRFYIGEIAYRGEIHIGDHEPILARDLFEAVQARLTEGAVARRLRTQTSAALLAGCLYDDLGNRMTPSHSQKGGVRYRYYVCHARLQRQSARTGAVPRVPAPEIEALVLGELKRHLPANATASNRDLPDDRALIESHVEKTIISGSVIAITLTPGIASDGPSSMPDDATADYDRPAPTVLTVS